MNGLPIALGLAAGLTLASRRRRGGSRIQDERPWIHLDHLKREKPWIHLDHLKREMASHKADVERHMGPISWEETFVMLSKAMKGLPNQTREDERAVQSESAALVHAVAWLQSGQQAFVVGPRLQEMFVATGLDKVPREALRLPYPSIWVALPGCPWRCWSKTQGWLRVRGFYASEHDGMWFVQAFAPVEGRSTEFSGTRFGLSLKDTYEDDEDLERSFLSGVTESVRSGHMGAPEPYRDEIVATTVNVLRTLVNLVLYLGIPDADLRRDPEYVKEAAERRALRQAMGRTTKKDKLRKLARREERLSEATVTWIGHRMEEAERREGVTVGDRAHPRRHWVRGHWKFVRKAGVLTHRWVHPYERGGLDGSPPFSGRTYKVR
jgi:hypothetical protein